MPQSATARTKAGPDFSLMTAESDLGQTNQSGERQYTVAQFAKLLKQQYPQVSNVDDYKLVGDYLQKYPQFKLRVRDVPIVPRGTNTQNLQAALGRVSGSMLPISKAARPVLGAATYGASDAMTEGKKSDPPVISPEVERGRLFQALPSILAAVASGGESRFLPGVTRAALGGVAGKALEDTGKAAVGSPEAPKDTGDLLEDVGEGGLEQGFYEVAGRSIAYPVRRVATGLMNRRPKALPEVVGDRYNIHFTPGQTSEKTIPEALERRAEYNPFARQVVEKGRAGQKEAAKTGVDNLISMVLGTAPSNITGKRTQAAITDIGSPLFKREVTRLQSLVNARTMRTRVNTLALKAEAQHELQEALKLVRSGQGGAALTTAAPASGRLAILQDIVKLPDEVPFTTLMQLRTKWMGIGPQTTELLSNEAKGTAKHYVQQVTRDLDDTLRGTPAMVDWLKFRNFTRKGAEVFESDAIVRALNQEPEKIVQQVGPKDITNAQAMRRAVISYAEKYGTPAEIREAQRGWRGFQQAYIRDQIIAPLHGDMTQLSKRLEEFKPGVLNTIFSDAKSRVMLSQLRDIGKALEKITPNVRVMHGHEVTTPRAIVGAVPALVISKIAYSPRATRFYLRGLEGLAQASKRPLVQAGGRAIGQASPYLGRAMSDMIRAYQIAGLYGGAEALPAPSEQEFTDAEQEQPQ